jgi:hypothetical protein
MQEDKLARLIETSNVDFDIQNVFLKAWELYKSRALLHSSFMLLMLSIQGIFVLYAAEFSLVYSILLAPPFYSGYFLVANKISNREAVKYGDFFGGFGYWMITVSIWLIAQMIVAVGLLLFIVPGIYLAVSYIFATLFGIFGGFNFWQSLEYSRKLVARNFWMFLAFVLILAIINLGPAALSLLNPGFAIAFAVWICVSIPISFLAVYVVFEELTSEVFTEEDKS